jgi:cation:H+ antiporter
VELMTILLFVLGLALLGAGADVLVRGASRLATAAGVSPLVVGLTIVAFGTSAPELAVAVQAALTGDAGANLVVGNVVGSNIFNVLVILGLSAIITPLTVVQQLVRVDVPVMAGVSVLMLVLALDGRITTAEGTLLFGGIVVYLIYAGIQGRREGKAAIAASDETVIRANPGGSVWLNLAYVAAGLVLLVLGSRWLVAGAIDIARTLGLSELIIGLTIVAAGTSLPEVAASVAASLKGERDLAVGNVVGSCLFNILAVLGLAALVAPGGIAVATSALHFDIPVMIAVAFACLPIFLTGCAIARWEGLLFLGYYVAYTAFLVLQAAEHDAVETFGAVMLVFVLPLTALWLTVSLGWHLRRTASGRPAGR